MMTQPSAFSVPAIVLPVPLGLPFTVSPLEVTLHTRPVRTDLIRASRSGTRFLCATRVDRRSSATSVLAWPPMGDIEACVMVSLSVASRTAWPSTRWDRASALRSRAWLRSYRVELALLVGFCLSCRSFDLSTQFSVDKLVPALGKGDDCGLSMSLELWKLLRRISLFLCFAAEWEILCCCFTRGFCTPILAIPFGLGGARGAVS